MRIRPRPLWAAIVITVLALGLWALALVAFPWRL